MFRYLMVLAGCACVSVTMAQEPPRQAEAQTATEALLQVQTAQERDQSMQRWLDTYKYVIPDFYRWTKMTSSNN